MAGGGDRVLREWARRAKALRRVPVDDVAVRDISDHLETAALRRAQRGVGPDGTPFKPLSKAWAKRKGHARFWVGRSTKGHRGGESIKKLKNSAQPGRRGIVTVIHQVINTPYSGAVHDGATIHRTSRPHSVETRRAMVKKGQTRAKAYSQRLAKINGLSGKGSYAKAREIRAEELRLARNARARGAASLMRQHQRKRDESFNLRHIVGSLLRPGGKTYTVRIPPRPILGVSAQDKVVIGRLLAKSAKRRMEGEGNG